MHKERKVGRVFVYCGISTTSFGLGFNISRWSFSADFGPLWVGVEW